MEESKAMRRACFTVSLLLAGLGVGSAHAEEKYAPEAVPGPVVVAPGPVCCPPMCCPAVCEVCCPASAGGFYGSAEYLVWWLRGDNLPPLVTFGGFNDAPFAGALGQPGTVLVFGGDGVSTGAHSGGRFTLGYALADGAVAVEAGYFLLEQRSRLFNAFTNGTDPLLVIARPFFNTDLNQEDSSVVAAPLNAGGVAARLRDRLQGAELNLRVSALENCSLRVGLLGGFRFLALDESLDVTSSTNDLTGLVGSATVADSFSTRNRFYGGQLGVTSEFASGRWSVNASARFALGGTHQTVTILGQTSAVDPTGAVTVFQGGFLAQPSNIGNYSRDEFAFVPEFRIDLAYNVRAGVTAFLGYTLLYDSSVVRPGEEIDRSFPTLGFPGVPTGATQPSFSFQDSTFWAQGINFGLELRF